MKLLSFAIICATFEISVSCLKKTFTQNTHLLLEIILKLFYAEQERSSIVGLFESTSYTRIINLVLSYQVTHVLQYR